MKRFFIPVLLLMTLAGAAQTEKPFVLEGTVKNIPNAEKVLLQYRKNGQSIQDSSNIIQGRYSFRGMIAEPVTASIRVKYVPAPGGNAGPITRREFYRDFSTIFISPANMQATSVDSFSNITVRGSVAHDEYSKVQVLLKPFEDKEEEMSGQYGKYRTAKDEAGMKRAEKQLDSIDEVMKGVYKKYVKSNPASPIATYAIGQASGYFIDPAETQPLFDLLSPEVKKLPSAVALAEKIDIARKTSVGSMAMDFIQNDTSGNPVSLSSFKGKVVLVDFWASWCGPCRAENPNVVKAFNKYKEKGFYVLGVSLDQPGAKEKWIKAIHDDNLTWAHVSDLKYWGNEVAKQYGVQAIPFNVLIDKQGKIIGRNLRSESLEQKLAEVL